MAEKRTLEDFIKNIDVDEVKKLAKEVDVNEVKKLAKDVAGDVDVMKAVIAFKKGDSEGLRKAVKDVDLTKVKEFVDADGDGDCKDDVEKLIKKISK